MVRVSAKAHQQALFSRAPKVMETTAASGLFSSLRGSFPVM